MDILAIALSSIFSVITLILTVITIYNTKKLHGTNTKLAELELMARTQQANILIFFKSEYREADEVMLGRNAAIAGSLRLNTAYYLIIKNVGNVSAKNIKISITQADKDDQPIPAFDGLEPIEILASGLEIPIHIPFTHNHFGMNFISSWSWEDKSGPQERKSNLKLW